MEVQDELSEQEEGHEHDQLIAERNDDDIDRGERYCC